MNSNAPLPDRQHELQKIVDMHRAGESSMNRYAGGDPVIPEERHGGVTDLRAADRHTGTGEGAETRAAYPTVY